MHAIYIFLLILRKVCGAPLESRVVADNGPSSVEPFFTPKFGVWLLLVGLGLY